MPARQSVASDGESRTTGEASLEPPGAPGRAHGSDLDPAALPITAGLREFTICPDSHGHWLVVEAHGMLGGVFVSRQAAERFALHEADDDPARVHVAALRRRPMRLGGRIG
jgi:hypothetical protein